MTTQLRDAIPGRKVTFRDGTSVYAVCLADRCEPHPYRDFGLYLDASWAPTWLAAVLDWPDFGLPTNERDAVAQIRDAFQRAQNGQHVEVGCLGGLGRTGTVLACMAILAGERSEEAVKWVRTNYDARAIENNKQEVWVMTFGNWEWVWCYYRNLVHTVYREIGHIGEPGDKEAKYQVPDQYLPAAQQCRKHRQTLKSSVPFRNTKGVKTDDVICCYEALTGLTLEELLATFHVAILIMVALVDAERQRSPAAGSGSEERADAVGSQVQCHVGQCPLNWQTHTE